VETKKRLIKEEAMSEDRLGELERRIARLESRIDDGTAPRRPARGGTALTAVLRDWRHAAEEQSLPGTVGYVGAAYVGGGEYIWARQESVAALLAADWSPAVGILEALGSAPRLAVLGALLREGCRTSAELQEALGGDQEETTSGQLYHHLRVLQGARLIVQRRRGEYRLAPEGVVTILTILAAALNIATDAPVGALPCDGEPCFDAEVRVNGGDFGLTWNQLGMVSMDCTVTIHAVFTRR
jgi:DNA-binding transcriptional ArsR family regulator